MAQTPDSTPYSAGFFDQQSAGSLSSARIVLREMFGAASFRSVVDVGCGVGSWLRVAIDFGADRATGLDGDYVDHDRLMIEPSRFHPCNLETENLRQASGSGMPFELAMCMEVAEHLPPGRAASFVAELCDLSDLVLFSAAVPGQGGTNHVNEQWPDYWTSLFGTNGYACFDILRARLWDRTDCEWWYLQNVLLFARKGSPAFEVASRLGSPLAVPPMAIVHPRFVAHTVRYAVEHIAEQLFAYQPFGREQGVRQLEGKVDALRTLALGRAEEVDTLRNALHEATAAGETARVGHEQLKRLHDATIGSTSWRVTGPLRRAVTLVRRRSA